MLANYLIGLREGLEASLVVGILVAYLVKTGHRDRLPAMWAGIAVAVALSLGVGALLTFTSSTMTFEQQEMFGGLMSIVAVTFVTAMVFWMRRAARGLKKELHDRLDAALAVGTTAILFTAFLSVAREGLETAVFLWAAVKATGEGAAAPLTGASLGLLTAVSLGWLIYSQAVRVNLQKFFTWTGAGLIIVAAGVLSYGIHDLQEAGVLPGLHSLAFDVSNAVPPSSWYGALLKGTVNFSPASTWLEVCVWLAYIIPVAVLFFRPKKPLPQPAPPAPSTAVTAA